MESTKKKKDVKKNPITYTFLPVRAKNAKKIDLNERLSLKKGKYDRDYVISLITILLSYCEYYKFDGANFPFSLRVSLEALLRSIDGEAFPIEKDPIMSHYCSKCAQTIVIRKSEIQDHVCEKSPKRLTVFK
jgi:hypothetical protein